jgi:ABC-2 type transport system ATP-binding protein
MSRHPKPPRRGETVAALPPAALAAEAVAKDYGDRPALEPLDLRIETGERVALIGHNGSGKTTFLRIAAGLLDASSGRITVNGHPAGSMEARAAISYMSDTPTFYDDLSVWEHLEYVARLHGVSDWQQHAADLLGAVGLYDRADDLPNTFSRGLRQKAAIAIAFVRPFDVLLVDEPFVGLDADGKDALLDLFDLAADDGSTLVVATHELGYVERSERVIALRDGRLTFDGARDDADPRALVSLDGGERSERSSTSDGDDPSPVS